MREHLFRGKRKDNGEWVIGSLIHCGDGSALIAKSQSTAFVQSKTAVALNGCYDVIPETVGEFTGLTDKNVVNIFEGDIVVCRQYIGGNWVDYCVELGYVEMVFGAFGLHRKQGYYRPFKDWLEDYEFEVISNIHDNPELLKEASE